MNGWPELFGLTLSKNERKCLIDMIRKVLSEEPDEPSFSNEVTMALLRDILSKLHDLKKATKND